MAFYTKSDARYAASQALQRTYLRKSFNQILNESIATVNDYQTFDVFLSHSFLDAELILGVKLILEENGLTVYVDWHNDPKLSRANVTKETAALLRKRMHQSKSLIYVATDNAPGSKWMPWELGFFDGLRNGSVAILPLLEHSHSSFKGQEYLGLYPIVEKGEYTNGNKDVFVEEKGIRWTTLRSFGKGATNWQRYGQ